jgi:hypothetical protein
MNYIYVNALTGINMKEYACGLGLQFSFHINANGLNVNNYFKYFNSKIINCEIGYRNIMGNNKFYFSINADIILTLYSVSQSGRGIEGNL